MFSMCLLCPCKSEIPVKLSSGLSWREAGDSFPGVLYLLLPSFECGQNCSAASGNSDVAAQHGEPFG